MMKVVVDTSVWIDHFRRHNPSLLALLELDVILAHPMILGELRCGSLPEPRATALATLEDLELSAPVDVDEVIDLIEEQRIFGKGCGLVDLSLLMSTLKTPGAQLWAADRRLAALAGRLGVAYVEAPPRGARPAPAALTAACPTA
ncbi:type II toxin-antitoxin system VapC family toxin [Mitsuaria sp. GD03876]|uniref:type II toxin-antitoxin system VapC family toxin n=1 Tax=Mitsuaria sp. GD03876 TaxID=2975399 RepID=UPI00244B7070|nr:type II toxin-antitoxin system VapC family toxin [Mitsuaria sp. GD03876]MDH0863113.1 type II toxin-antitoxin system VapC family toxin [Mitsuaria sp. GD03876]